MEEKYGRLYELMEEYTRDNVAVAFSGGVDSSLLLKLAVVCARERKSRVIAVTAATELHPSRDEAIAGKVALETGAEHRVLRVQELEQAGVAGNPVDRCYRCKRYLFERIRQEAEAMGASVVLEGTNADDLSEYRPGLKAIRELGIKSPLMEAGLTKEEVRRLAGEYGISVARRPSSPCLATRFPYGEELTYEKLRQVEKGENYLKTLGLYNVRLRVHGRIVRIEADAEQMGRLVERREEIVGFLKELGYGYITLDLEGFRSGSMDETLSAEEKSMGNNR
ncbi:MAG: ATP-dependent sacrificial sulfur transferase LarE [Hungatella sp.]|nr:ATP-dependent sacrificial sulfur transferase LarE [Hungatella sp.]